MREISRKSSHIQEIRNSQKLKNCHCSESKDKFFVMSPLNANTMSMEDMKSKLLNYKTGDIHGVTSFRDADPDEMSDFNIRIGVFGPTGSGKSALINTVSKILRGAGEEVAISQSAGGEGTRVLDEITFGGFSMFDTRGFFNIESPLEETEFFRILYGSVRPGEEIVRGTEGALKTKSAGIAAHKLNKPPLKKQLHVVLWIIKGDDIRLITEQYQDKLNFILSKLRDEAITMVTVITHGDVISQMYNAEEFQENIRSQALHATKTCEDHAFVVQNWTENVNQLDEPVAKEVLKMILTALDCGERSVKMRQTKRKRLELQMKGERGIRSIWDEEHRPIHDEALDFYLDPNRKTLGKFVSKPMPKAHTVVRRTVGQKDTKTDRPKSFNQHEPLSAQGKKSDQLYPKDGDAPKREMFPPENNAGRVLPAQPKQLENLKYDFPKPASSKSMDVDEVDSPIQKRAFPAVHVVSMLPQSDDFLNNPAMNLLGRVFQNLNIPWGPHFPDIKPKDLPKHVKATSPDLVVLVSEYEDLIDVKSLNNQLKQFRDLLQSVKNEESSKLVIVVTGDKFYKQGDMSSTVEKEVKDINDGILKQDKLKILSWNSYPSYTHQDVIANLLRMFKPKELQQKVSNRSLVTPEHDVKRGTLRCRSIIQDGRVLAILKSDPSDWSPRESLLSDVMAKCRGRCKVELWEDSSGDINVSMSSAALLCKVLEIPSTERRHSLQVYGYHTNTRIFDVVKTFIKGLDLEADVHPRNTKIDLPALLQNIAVKQPEFVVFFLDMDFFRYIRSIQEHVLKYSSNVSALVNLKGIIIMLVGDENCRDGDPVSDVVKQSVMQLKSEIQIDPNKITVLSWREKPCIKHYDTVKDLLIKSKQQSSPQPYYGAQKPAKKTQTTSTPLPNATEFDLTKGYLRYRALLEYGRVVKEIVRLPPNWNPDESDLNFIADKYRDVQKAVLEFWADSYDRPPKGPVVKDPEKSCLSKITSWFRKNDGDYV